MNEKKTRGDAINKYLDYIKRKWGEKGLAECVKDLGLKVPLSDLEFYPDEVMVSVLHWILEKKGRAALVSGGKYVVKNLGVLGWLVKLASPKFIAGRFEKNYHELYTFGRFETDTSQDRKVVIRMYDLYSGPERCIAWEGICQGTLELTNTNGEVKKTKCVGKGDKYCEFIMQW